MIHELKTIPEYFEAIATGEKTFEVRKNDRLFSAGDFLALNEYKPDEKSHTGRCMLVRVTYILESNEYCKDGYVIMGISPCALRDNKEAETYRRSDNPFCVPVYSASFSTVTGEIIERR